MFNNKRKNYAIDNVHVLCEDLGDGYYISPIINVAAFHAGFFGKIFKHKLNTDKIAQTLRKSCVIP